MTTVPDIGLECHLFVQKLVGDHDLGERETLHAKILAWISKMEAWNDDGFIHGFEPVLRPHFVALMTHIRKKENLSHDVEVDGFQSLASIKQIGDAYDAMLLKQQDMHKTDMASYHAKQESLLQWKTQKIQAIEMKSNNLQGELKKTEMTIRDCLDLLLDEVQRAHGHQGAQTTDVQTTSNDPMMLELEALMNGSSLDSVLKKRTLELGECGSPPKETVENAQPPFTQYGSTPIPESQGTTLMQQDTPQEAAFKHISSLEDGPIKSSLMALCSASCQARKGDGGYSFFLTMNNIFIYIPKSEIYRQFSSLITKRIV